MNKLQFNVHCCMLLYTLFLFPKLFAEETILNKNAYINYINYIAENNMSLSKEDCLQECSDIFFSSEHANKSTLSDSLSPKFIVSDTTFSLLNICESIDSYLNSQVINTTDLNTEGLEWEVQVDLWGDWTYDFTYSTALSSTDQFFIHSEPGDWSYISKGDDVENLFIKLPDGVPINCKYQHRVLWRLNDDIGNVVTATNYFFIKDGEEPTPTLLDTFKLYLQQGEAILNAVDLNTGSTDLCTNDSNLFYTFSPIHPNDIDYFDGIYYNEFGSADEEDFEIGNAERWNEELNTTAKFFDCDDIPLADYENRIFPIEIYVWDECHNYDKEIVYLELVDLDQYCCLISETFSLIGIVETESEVAIPDVKILAKQIGTNYFSESINNLDGYYAVYVPLFYNDLVIDLTKNDDYKTGLSTLDIIHIQRHILEIAQLGSDYKMNASDVNKDELISDLDIDEIRNLLLNKVDKFSAVEPWTFYGSDTISLDNLMNFANFVGVKNGDANASIDKILNGSIENENLPERELYVNIQEDNGLTNLEFSTSKIEKLHGFQMALDLKGVDVNSINYHLENMDESNFGMQDSSIIVSWNTKDGVSTEVENFQKLFSISLPTSSINNLELTSLLNDSIIKSEFYFGDELNVRSIKLIESPEQSENIMHQVYPNPAFEQIIVPFNIKESGLVKFKIFDITGKFVKESILQYSKGYNEFSIKVSQLKNYGSLFVCQMEFQDFLSSQKVIVLTKP